MKSSGLLSILTFSEKRKELLFLLLEEPKSLSEIKNYFGVSSPEISPRIKEMEEANLICKSDKRYHITSIGKIAAKYLQPLLDYLNVIEKHEDFWKEHTLQDIPEELLERLSDLNNCELLEDSTEHIYESHKEFTDNISKSTVVKGLSSIFIPTYPPFFEKLAINNVPTSLILTEPVFEKVKNEHTEQIQTYLDAESTSLYVLDDAKLAFVVTDYFFSLSLYFENGRFDPHKDLLGFDDSALNWGDDLFNYYKNKSREIKSL
ncbi:transcriptional regulator, ArsR family [Methanohalobium evestigatum Z-7303]|uniref:Transcriptional regulator, ArsR family n=1 Tax=Methanohalobium evestigatum (strain ATCC BAA-1072 / DSM 3721 / NBRC 107634 / OCM 161 / Z-7303) TaxID=644295 RepID=D7EBV5_METEZ|nr:winged helix-turn-helix domain-containing protein [Methanohalobium evestigatum]ADI75077.1 transcriptional regulator, ArsR family [Methanohalobium evestigatum Z-7303]